MTDPMLGPICNVYKLIAEKIRSEIPVVDISVVMADVEALLNKSIAAEGYVMPPLSNDPARYIDLCKVDFEALKSQFDKGRKAIEAQELMAFAKKLTEEEKGGLGETLKEELVTFDLLTKPAITLGKQEMAEVTKVAKSLVAKLKQEKLVLDWGKQQTTRAIVFTTIKDILDERPRAYTKELYDQKCDLVNRHFYESYMGQGKSFYAVN